MTDVLPYRGGSGKIPFFAFIESERPSLFSIGSAGVLTILFSIFLVVGMEYEIRHPIALPVLRPKVDEPPTGISPRPEVVFSCELLHGSGAGGPNVRLAAQVRALSGLPMPSGQVRFLVGYETLKIVKMENGAVTLTTRLPKAELQQPLRALYLGDGNYAPNYSNVGNVGAH